MSEKKTMRQRHLRQLGYVHRQLVEMTKAYCMCSGRIVKSCAFCKCVRSIGDMCHELYLAELASQRDRSGDA